MTTTIFIVGFVIFVTYMFFLVRMINISHKKQEIENGPNGTYKKPSSKNMKEMKKIIKELED